MSTFWIALTVECWYLSLNAMLATAENYRRNDAVLEHLGCTPKMTISVFTIFHTLVSTHRFLDLEKLASGLTFFPQLAGLTDHLERWFIEHFGGFVNSQTGNFRVEENDKNPADEADGSVEAKSPARSERVHLGEERRRNNDCSRSVTVLVFTLKWMTYRWKPSKSR